MTRKYLFPKINQKFLFVFGKISETVQGLSEFSAGAFAESHSFHAAASCALNIFNQWNVISIARNQHYHIKTFGKLDCIDRDAHIPIAFFGSTWENLQIFGLDFKALFLQCFKKFFLLTFQGFDSISDGADENSFAH